MLPPHSRRSFLRRSLMLSGVAAAGPLFQACSPPTDLPVPELGFLSPGIYRFLHLMSRELLAGVEPGFDVVVGVDALLAVEEGWLQRQFLGAAWLMEFASIPKYGARFSRLPQSQRLPALQNYAESSFAPLRQGLQGVYNAVMFSYYSAQESWQALGYEGPWVGGQP